MTEQQTWFITGANRGIGASIAKAALAAGHNVVATARRAETVTDALGASDALLAEALDITSAEQITAAVAVAEAKFGRIDVLVNNAGYGQLGLFEETSFDLVKKQIDTNLYGTMEVTRAVLALMRRQGSGHVITISSIAGTFGVTGSSVYSASKFALEGWMEGLKKELAPLGIEATIVEPGFFKTDFLDSSSVVYGDITIEDYAEESAAFRKSQDDMNHQQVGDPDKLAQATLDLVAADRPPLRFAAGEDAVSVVETILDQRRDDLDTWRTTSTSLGL
ncbi:SDR family NAD(P)-dependent oxidoreductase [Rathayibacter sp. VKM Ac-2754]|uniref:SDR family NAD(P)-dependent oxidoreductase n=1 Tax=Rathayibacter sp. VKM Ac-2754 TaxID=2609251 RepID=UPI0013577649|nr:SDR family NAD(P)-dependent oxidoreductase [Rathayibacter sp. VKM Ac-2754]MWV58850.1 SDR family NAD(P)-dependent oxidoreductase [Rathayibacter sp. VKM Ac-2754]